jgi:hypothetical protein
MEPVGIREWMEVQFTDQGHLTVLTLTHLAAARAERLDINLKRRGFKVNSGLSDEFFKESKPSRGR